jgi:hypothetical protein
MMRRARAQQSVRSSDEHRRSPLGRRRIAGVDDGFNALERGRETVARDRSPR